MVSSAASSRAGHSPLSEGRGRTGRSQERLQSLVRRLWCCFCGPAYQSQQEVARLRSPHVSQAHCRCCTPIALRRPAVQSRFSQLPLLSDEPGIIETNAFNTAFAGKFHFLPQREQGVIVKAFHHPADMLRFLSDQPCKPVHARQVTNPTVQNVSRLRVKMPWRRRACDLLLERVPPHHSEPRFPPQHALCAKAGHERQSFQLLPHHRLHFPVPRPQRSTLGRPSQHHGA